MERAREVRCPVRKHSQGDEEIKTEIMQTYENHLVIQALAILADISKMLLYQNIDRFSSLAGEERRGM